MLWLLEESGLLTEMQSLEFQLLMLETPLGDGRIALDLITDERSLAFIDLKRQRLAGVEIDPEAWAAAADAADVAAYAAAGAAAYAAAGAAAGAAADAADAAACAAAYAGAYARAAALCRQADKIREIIPNFPMEVEIV
jgi:hypothetical protein